MYKLNVIKTKQIALEVIKEEPAEHSSIRPRKRWECIGSPRPCPWVSCRYHLYLDVKPRTGSLIINHNPDNIDHGDAVAAMKESCALDVADRHDRNYEKISPAMGLLKDQFRHIQRLAISRLRKYKELKNDHTGAAGWTYPDGDV